MSSNSKCSLVFLKIYVPDVEKKSCLTDLNQGKKNEQEKKISSNSKCSLVFLKICVPDVEKKSKEIKLQVK